MNTTKFEVGQSVLVKAEIEHICIDKDHGTTYGLIIKDCFFVEDGQSNKQHVAGIAEKDIAIEALLSADRPRGQWEYCKHTGISDVWKCDQCGAWMFGKTNYCHNCGADMRSEVM